MHQSPLLLLRLGVYAVWLKYSVLLEEGQAWAVEALTPHDADGLGNFMAGLHVVSELLLHELHEATGEPPEATLQRLAILAEHRRGTPSVG